MMLMTVREAINELTPVEQLQAINAPFQQWRDKPFHELGHECGGGTIGIYGDIEKYACDICGEEKDM